ncbi:DUF3310 domain-containing protein [uncultured Ottowia sp.]|uniref:DUF3310 domain-containing protein n=1 Tax=uncultured Ottowia sp. TaxID=543067 RepID=UPI00259462EC|nr:DUF3310 domain-containing protein [uncultured Ottowia sp.]
MPTESAPPWQDGLALAAENIARMRGQALPASARQEGGDHYRRMAVQPWDAIQAWMSRKSFEDFLRACAIKYLARCDAKGGLQDLRKARHCLDKLIEVRESKGDGND